MDIIYFTVTGNCERFIERCNLLEKAKNIRELRKSGPITNDYILIFPTLGFGEIPVPIKKFLNNKTGAKEHLKGVISSGNRNWGTNFAIAGDLVSEEYNVPLLLKIELHGNTEEREQFKNIYNKLK